MVTFCVYNISKVRGCRHSSVDSSTPTIPGSSPKHAIYAFSFIVFVLYLSCEKNENKQKEAGFGPFLKTNITKVLVYHTYIFMATFHALGRSSLLLLKSSLYVICYIMGSVCGSVGRVVASNSRGPQFESSHQKTFILNIYLLSTVLKRRKKKSKRGQELLCYIKSTVKS